MIESTTAHTHMESYFKTPFLEEWRTILLKHQTPTRAVLWNIVFFGIGIWAYIVLKKKVRLSSPEAFLSIAMLGVLAYMTLFESGDRYVMQFWPLFFILSGLGFMRVKKELVERTGKGCGKIFRALRFPGRKTPPI